MYRAAFQIPNHILENIISGMCFDKIKKELKIKDLYIELIKVIKSKPIIKIKKCGGWLGLNHCENNIRDEIWIDPRVTLAEMPAVLIHECFHSLFLQLTEPEILKLEFWFMRDCSKKQLNTLINFIWKSIHIDFVDYKKRVIVENITKRK